MEKNEIEEKLERALMQHNAKKLALLDAQIKRENEYKTQSFKKFLENCERNKAYSPAGVKLITLAIKSVSEAITKDIQALAKGSASKRQTGVDKLVSEVSTNEQGEQIAIPFISCDELVYLSL